MFAALPYSNCIQYMLDSIMAGCTMKMQSACELTVLHHGRLHRQVCKASSVIVADVVNQSVSSLYACLQWPVQQNSLRWLSDHYLQQTIQSGAHDSKEDAIAALRLVNLKLQQGPFFDKSHNADTHNLIDLLHEQDRYIHLLSVSTADISNIDNTSGVVFGCALVTYCIKK